MMKLNLSLPNSPSSEIDQFQSNVEMLKVILGDDYSYDRIRHALRGADGKPDIALNHMLNDKENERAGCDNMASASSLTPLEKVLCDLAEEVKCPMCLGYFRQPMVLTCLHTFCTECLEELVCENSIQCPLCRTVVTLTERGINGLKPNHYLANIVEKLKAAQSTKMCAECQKSICTVFCKQCRAFLCDDCNERIHSFRSLITHHRIPFEEMFLTNISGPTNQVQFYDVSYESDYVIPFNVKKEVCLDLFYFWVKDLWFAPSDLARRATLTEFKALYIPHWLFEVESTSSFNCMVGFPDRLDERDPSTRVYWSPSSGSTSGKFSDIIVCASDAPEVQFMSHFEPWRLEQAQPFTLKHVEGAEVLAFSMESDKAWTTSGKQLVEELNKDICEKKLKRGTGGPTSVSNMVIDSSFVIKKSRRLFVPIYSATFEYRGTSYRILINGSTAKVSAQRPYSTSKLASLSVTGIGAAIGLITSRLNQ